MKKIITFYDDIFQYHYNRLKGNDSTPEVTPLAIISYMQATQALFIYIIFHFFFDLADFLSLYMIGIIIYLIVIGINFYIFIIKNRRDKILRRSKLLSKKLVLIQNLVSYGSMLFIVIVIILLRECF